MKRNIIFLLFCSLCISVWGARIDGSVYATLEKVSEDSVYFRITNKLNDTIYFFDSYRSFDYTALDNAYSMSEYLHRYNPHTKIYKFSLTPILHRLGYHPGDLVVSGADGVIRGYARFVFRHISPAHSIVVSLPVRSILMTDYIEDVNLDDEKFYKKRNGKKILEAFKDIKRYKSEKQRWLCIEFAYYYDSSIVEYVEHPKDGRIVTDKMLSSFNIFSISLLVSND